MISIGGIFNQLKMCRNQIFCSYGYYIDHVKRHICSFVFLLQMVDTDLRSPVARN